MDELKWLKKEIEDIKASQRELSADLKQSQNFWRAAVESMKENSLEQIGKLVTKTTENTFRINGMNERLIALEKNIEAEKGAREIARANRAVISRVAWIAITLIITAVISGVIITA